MAKYCSVGGQALIEGIMMRGGSTSAIAVRKSDGSFETKVDVVEPIKNPILRLPFVRGAVALISSMVVGMKALTWSAEFYEEPGMEEEEISAFEKWLMEKLGDKADAVIMAISVVIAIGLAFLLFAALPAFLVSLLRSNIQNQMILSALEGVTKILLFIGYVLLISQKKEIKRVFQYHGAEHKTIHCFEAGKPLTVENVQSFSTLHPRCGTSFILIVILISIAIFTFVSWNSLAFRIFLKVVLLPIIAGVSYEIIKWTGAHEGLVSRILRYPGMMMQKLTTKEPDDGQVETAIVAMNLVLEKEGIDACFN